MPVTTLAPLLTRIAEVLIDGAGSSRTLPPGDRFLDAHYGDAPAQGSRNANECKRCIAFITGMRERSFNSELWATATYEIDVLVETTYFVNHPAQPSVLRATLAAAALDGNLVRAALCWPGNLSATTAAAPTGLVDGCLTFRSYVLGKPDRTARVMTGTFQFVGAVEITHPT